MFPKSQSTRIDELIQEIRNLTELNTTLLQKYKSANNKINELATKIRFKDDEINRMSTAIKNLTKRSKLQKKKQNLEEKMFNATLKKKENIIKRAMGSDKATYVLQKDLDRTNTQNFVLRGIVNWLVQDIEFDREIFYDVISVIDTSDDPVMQLFIEKIINKCKIFKVEQ